MKINAIHHVAIICSDFEKSKQFYVEVLGFTPIGQIYRSERDSFKLDLQLAGRYQIELFSFPGPPERPSFPEACGLRHLAFEVDDIDAAHKDLLLRNIRVEQIRFDEVTRKKFFFFSDPDDLPLEMYEK